MRPAEAGTTYHKGPLPSKRPPFMAWLVSPMPKPTHPPGRARKGLVGLERMSKGRGLACQISGGSLPWGGKGGQIVRNRLFQKLLKTRCALKC